MTAGLPKIKLRGTGTFTPPTPTPTKLSRESKPGDYITWSTIRHLEASVYVGILNGWNDNIAMIKLADGTRKIVEC